MLYCTISLITPLGARTARPQWVPAARAPRGKINALPCIIFNLQKPYHMLMINTSSQPIGQQFLISGRVQGVFYRRFAKQAAAALEITGWARNLPDGCVEIHAFGPASQLTIYQNKLWEGPPAAMVKEVLVQALAWEPHQTFEVKA